MWQAERGWSYLQAEHLCAYLHALYQQRDPPAALNSRHSSLFVDPRNLLAVGGASGQRSEEWLSLRQCTHTALWRPFPAKHKLYSIPLIWDQLKDFVTAT